MMGASTDRLADRLRAEAELCAASGEANWQAVAPLLIEAADALDVTDAALEQEVDRADVRDGREDRVLSLLRAAVDAIEDGRG